ncbi:hypothetical protein ASZ90_013441 [hydrocarbon metagenome]|uniref:Uncharacterized protein n=1 Tax=hydrocarbon metagenome TaxID=938273 RepID=A0A0W8F7Q9_9ZZZZ
MDELDCFFYKEFVAASYKIEISREFIEKHKGRSFAYS